MARTLITVSTAAYTRTHGHAPRQPRMQGKVMWAFTIDNEAKVVVKYETYAEALKWAKAQATTSVEVLP